jgi:hypothetical protein
MKLPLFVKSNYYKALLVLSRRDRIIDPGERKLLIRIGKMLDFDKRFCEAAINDLLSNPHISRSPIIFPDENIKECFFRDALQLAHSDALFHPAESRWLRQMAHANGWSDERLESLIRDFRKNMNEKNPHAPLEIQQHL